MNTASLLNEHDAILVAVAAAGLDILARLHDREPDAELILGLRNSPLAAWFTAFSRAAPAEAFDEAVAALTEQPDAVALDELAVAYADIYLTHAHRASPTSSVWLTEDQTERQEPMFAVRGWYEHYGMSVPDWRSRADDHLVHQLQFLAHLCRLGSTTSALDAARFLDSNLLKWLPLFAGRVSERSNNRYFVTLAVLTASVVEDLRDLLVGLTGHARPQTGVADSPLPSVAAMQAEDTRYVPGLAESW